MHAPVHHTIIWARLSLPTSRRVLQRPLRRRLGWLFFSWSISALSSALDCCYDIITLLLLLLLFMFNYRHICRMCEPQAARIAVNQGWIFVCFFSPHGGEYNKICHGEGHTNFVIGARVWRVGIKASKAWKFMWKFRMLTLFSPHEQLSCGRFLARWHCRLFTLFRATAQFHFV